MIRFKGHGHLFTTALAGVLFFAGGSAQAETTDVLDLSAGAGFSTNAGFHQSNGASGFGRISAIGNHSWVTERSSASIHGFVEDTFYFKNYGSQSIFTVGANTNFAASPTVSLYGNLNFFGDFNGQLANRLTGVPGGPPPVTDPNNPLPPPTTIPGVLGFGGRSYRADGQIGASIRSSERSTISLAAGAQHAWFTGNSNSDYTTYHGNVGYSLQVSERTSVGPTVYVTHQDFTHGTANIVNPSIAASTQLSDSITASGALGVLVLNQDRLGQTDTTVSPSFSLSICSHATLSSLCAHAARDANSALNNQVAIGRASSITTTGDITYYRQLSADGTLQASAYATHFSSSAPSPFNFSETYLSAVVGYDRKIGHRLFAGITTGARKVFQTGPDPNVDFNANLYLRYRFGDVQ